MENARRPGLEARTVAVDLPAPVFEAVQRESDKAGTPVEELIEGWVTDRINKPAA
jgi:hypothetical protein